MSKYPETLQKLIATLRKLPGVGQKTGERFGFQIISWKKEEIDHAAKILLTLKDNLCNCKACGALYEKSETIRCPFCEDETRDKSVLCVVSSPRDIFTLEQTHIYKGLYHVLDGLLSPIDGFGPDNIGFSNLSDRIGKLPIQEIILALDATIEGDATALYLKRELSSKAKVSRLALGMPLGSSLEYIDEGTLAQALSARS